MSDQSSHQVFISYATPDRDRVVPYFNWLKERGFEVWMDFRSIRPGQNWDFEIKRALQKSTFVVAFISKNSYSRRGYVQRELKIALDNLSEKLVDDIYIIPVLLDDETEIPDELKGIQCIFDSDGECKAKVVEALTFQLGRLGVQIDQAQRVRDLYWQSKVMRESWDGLPGYEFEAQLLTFSSETYANVTEIGDYLKGWIFETLFEQRAEKMSQYPDRFNYGQDKYLRTSTFDASCGEPRIKGRVMTLHYTVHWYGAGAAHPNFYFKTFSFMLDPLARIASLDAIFDDPSDSLKLVQDIVRRKLIKECMGDTEGELVDLAQSHMYTGTEKWADFSSFIFSDDHIEVLFAPYQVASYAEGAKFVEIPYVDVADFIRPEFKSLLGIEYVSSND